MKRMLLIALLMITIFSCMFIIAESQGYTNEAVIKVRLEGFRQAPYGQFIVGAIIFLLLAGDLILPVPSSIVMAMSGTFFGWFTGGLISFVASMLAALIGFGICRKFGAKGFHKIVGDEENSVVEKWLEDFGALAIIISRPVPMLTETLSCLAGLSDLPLKTFIIACILGHLPTAFLYSYVGSLGSITAPMPALIISLLVPAVGYFITLKIKRKTANE